MIRDEIVLNESDQNEVTYQIKRTMYSKCDGLPNKKNYV